MVPLSDVLLMYGFATDLHFAAVARSSSVAVLSSGDPLPDVPAFLYGFTDADLPLTTLCRCSASFLCSSLTLRRALGHLPACLYRTTDAEFATELHFAAVARGSSVAVLLLRRSLGRSSGLPLPHY